jgi:phosphatidylglycerophosphate synthase
VTGGANGLSPALRSLLPAIAVALYFVIGFIAFGVRSLWKGVARDHEIESRGESMLINFYFRNYFVWVVQPIWRLVLWSGLTANAVTGIAAGLGAASGLAAATGRFALAGWLFLFSGVLDVFDGRIARARGQVGPKGAVVDSILDRYADASLLIGLCWYFRGSWVLLPALAAMLGTSLVPYVRAKAETLGVSMTDGLMQRAERILYLGSALALTPILEAVLAPGNAHPFPHLAAAGVIFLAVTTNLTALRRFIRLMGAVGAGDAGTVGDQGQDQGQDRPPPLRPQRGPRIRRVLPHPR